MIAEACIGYSYKNFYECGVSIGKGPHMQDFQFEELSKIETLRRRKKMDNISQDKAIISYCQVEMPQGNMLIIVPREGIDTIIMFKIALMK